MVTCGRSDKHWVHSFHTLTNTELVSHNILSNKGLLYLLRLIEKKKHLATTLYPTIIFNSKSSSIHPFIHLKKLFTEDMYIFLLKIKLERKGIDPKKPANSSRERPVSLLREFYGFLKMAPLDQVPSIESHTRQISIIVVA